MLDTIGSVLPIIVALLVGGWGLGRPILRVLGLWPQAPELPEGGGTIPLLGFREVARGRAAAVKRGGIEGGRLVLREDGFTVGGLLLSRSLDYSEIEQGTIQPHGLIRALVLSPQGTSKDLVALMNREDAGRTARFLQSRGVAVSGEA